jgi:hypothetical protein
MDMARVQRIVTIILVIFQSFAPIGLYMPFDSMPKVEAAYIQQDNNPAYFELQFSNLVGIQSLSGLTLQGGSASIASGSLSGYAWSTDITPVSLSGWL